jgi:hypothetical protein
MAYTFIASYRQEIYNDDYVMLELHLEQTNKQTNAKSVFIFMMHNKMTLFMTLGYNLLLMLLLLAIA